MLETNNMVQTRYRQGHGLLSARVIQISVLLDFCFLRSRCFGHVFGLTCMLETKHKRSRSETLSLLPPSTYVHRCLLRVLLLPVLVWDCRMWLVLLVLMFRILPGLLLFTPNWGTKEVFKYMLLTS